MPRSGRWARPAARIAAATAVAGASAVLALLLLTPDAGPPPVHVEATRFFAPAQIERAADFRSGQRTLLLIGLAVELALLLLLALGRPRLVRRALTGAGRRPLAGAGAVGAGLALLVAVAALPTGLLAHDRAVDVGLSTQGTGDWLADRGWELLIAMPLAALGALVLVALQRRLPRLWWVVGSAVVIAYAVVSTWLAPVVLAPVFNDFEPLGEGRARAAVLDLAERADVDVGGVYRVDASRRSTALNAYVDGIGSSRRVVIYDNLLARAETAELRAVVAHELGHVAHRDLWRGLLFVALVAPAGMLFVAAVGGAFARRGGLRPGHPAALPGYVLAITLATLALGLAGNHLSRAVEASADRFALQLTGDPAGAIALQVRLARANLSDPTSAGWVDGLLRTHPSTMERIGAVLGQRRGGAPGGEARDAR